MTRIVDRTFRVVFASNSGFASFSVLAAEPKRPDFRDGFTIACWAYAPVNPTSFWDTYPLLGFTNTVAGNLGGFSIQITGSSNPAAKGSRTGRIDCAGVQVALTPYTAVSGVRAPASGLNWHHAIFTAERGIMRYYINGMSMAAGIYIHVDPDGLMPPTPGNATVTAGWPAGHNGATARSALADIMVFHAPMFTDAEAYEPYTAGRLSRQPVLHFDTDDWAPGNLPVDKSNLRVPAGSATAGLTKLLFTPT